MDTLHILTDKEYQKTLLQNVKIWNPSVPLPEVTVDASPKCPRIACILGDKLYHSLKFEANLLILTENNWEEVLQYGRVDFLLVESCWSSVSGDWYLAQTKNSKNISTLSSLLDKAKQLSIPSAYWNTADVLYFDVFNHFSKQFDYIFAADPKTAEKYSSENKRVEILYPAVQPRLFNPFKELQFADDLVIPILFEGWADIYRFKKDLAYLDSFLGQGLGIIESKYTLLKSKLDDIGELSQAYLGYVNFVNRITALKHSSLRIADAVSLATPTEQIWSMLETAACRVPCLFRKGDFDISFLDNCIISCEDSDELFETVQKMNHDDYLKETTAQKLWRNAHEHHSFSTRLQQLCSTLSVSYEKESFPLVSVVLPTFREALIERCVEQFDKQSYPVKELILVMNSNTFSMESVSEKIRDREDIKILPVPSNRVEGGCLNFGITAANGFYYVKMDDDDHYGENYILDMVLHNHSIDADIFGKSNCFFHFEDDNKTYKREVEGKPQFSVFNTDKAVKVHISGNSLSGKTSFFQKYNYSDMNIGSTDTHFHHSIADVPAKCALFDNLGVVVHRAANVDDHSWRTSSDELKKQMTFMCDGVPDFNV